MPPSTQWVIVEGRMVFGADIWRPSASACDSGPCFRFTVLLQDVLQVTPAEAARQEALVVSSKLSKKALVRFPLSCPGSLCSCWGPCSSVPQRPVNP